MAYTLSDLQSAVQDDLKDASFSTSRITRYLNAAQRLIFNTHLFYFCEKTVTGALTIGEESYAQQTDHQSTISGVLTDPTDSARYIILNADNYLPQRDFFNLYPDPSTQTQSMPSTWTEFGNQIIFNCPADKAYTFTQRYYKVPTELSGSTDAPLVPETFRELLEQYACYKAEKYRGNHDIAATYLQAFEDGLENMTIRYSSVQQVTPITMNSSRVWVSENE